MPHTTRHVCWLAIDTYSPDGVLLGSVLGARSLLSPEPPSTVLQDLLDGFGVDFEQLSAEDVLRWHSARNEIPTPPWEQLSIF